MEYEARKVAVLEPAEKSKRNAIVLTEPTDEAKEQLKRQLFGDHTTIINPEVADLLASVVPNGSDATFDDYSRETLAFASEVGIPMAELQRSAIDALARHTVNGLSEISVTGPGGEQIKKLEELAFKQLRRTELSEHALMLNPVDVMATERAARLPDLPTGQMSGDLAVGVALDLPRAGK